MGFEKIARWFLSEKGRNFSLVLAGTISGGVMLATSLPHTILIEPYKDFLHLYNKGLTVQLSRKLRERFEKALEYSEVDQRDRHLFQPFAAYGFDIVSAGTTYSRFGAIVGIPANFSYDSVDDIDKSKIKVNLESVAWDTDEGKLLLKSLVLSEKAQLYAMCREIKLRETAKVFFDTMFATASCVGTYGISAYFNEKLNLYNRPLPLRIVLYVLVVAFMGGNYFFLKDMTQIAYEEGIDKELKRKSPILVEGAREFYAKTLQRNIALRRLLGKEGESLYTALGNENYLLRHKHIPLVDRKLFFDKEDGTPETMSNVA